MYLDNASTTQPIEFVGGVTDAIPWGNPSSPHIHGLEAQGVMQGSLQGIADTLGVTKDEIVVVSGGTEASNMVILGGRWDTIVTTRLEHQATDRAVRYAKCTTLYLPNDKNGILDYDECTRYIRDNKQQLTGKRCVLFSVILGNNEIGTIQSHETLSAIHRSLMAVVGEGGSVSVHVDAVQVIGKCRFNLRDPKLSYIRYVSISAHKFHGPRGIGLLVCRGNRGATHRLQPIMYGGAQQNGMRPGTQHVMPILQMEIALRECTRDVDPPEDAPAYHGGTRTRFAVPRRGDVHGPPYEQATKPHLAVHPQREHGVHN